MGLGTKQAHRRKNITKVGDTSLSKIGLSKITNKNPFEAERVSESDNPGVGARLRNFYQHWRQKELRVMLKYGLTWEWEGNPPRTIYAIRGRATQL